MKKIYLALSAIVAVFCLSSITAHAQTQPLNVVRAYDKYVTGPDINGMYTITLETHATGTTVKKESEVMPPVNIIMLIDVSKAMHTNQLPVPLSLAVEQFICDIPQPTDPNKSHNISVFTFDETIEHEWHRVTTETAHTIQQTIAAFGTSGSLFSQPEYAFEKAIAEAQAFQKDAQTKDNQTMVIFFTSTRRVESGDLAWYDESSQSAVNLSYILKYEGTLPDGHKSVDMYGPIPKKGGSPVKQKTLTFKEGLNCKVFAIANYKPTKSATDGEEDEVKHFLNYVSSLYPEKWVSDFKDFTSTSEGTEEPNTTSYHLFSPKPAMIGEMFRTVQEEIAQPSIPINESSIVRDILTPDFKLPDGISESNLKNYVKVYTRDCIYSGAPNYTCSFSNERVDITNSVSVSLGGDRTINVSGFDFAAHYCGYDEKNGVKTPHAGGQRLVITIPIEPVADYQGGYNLPTNTEDSGIYTKDNEMIEKYPVPDLDFPSIGIIKYGLKQGESSTFTVQRVNSAGTSTGDTPFNIILSGTGGTTPVYTVLKDLEPGYYKVTETDWSWTYNVSGNSSITKALPMQASEEEDPTETWPEGITEKARCVLFTFTNAKNDDIDQSIYAESVAKNKFKGESTSAGSETVNSKTQSGASN